MRTLLFTTLALVGFAANSVLCRLALGEATIDAASFSTIRLASGALTLAVIAGARRREARDTARDTARNRGSWVSGAFLFLYAVPFSFAYVTLSAGTGALILFGAVQATMILAAIAGGERPHAIEWLGITCALGGLVYLVSPGLSAPSPAGSFLMTTAGIAWGVYSLRGRATADPVRVTADNFLRSVPFVVVVSVVAFRQAHLSPKGTALAIASGGAASGLGYVIWYAALRGLTATRAAIVQLSVPVLAALGGVVWLGEQVSLRLLLSAGLILGGVAMAVASRGRTRI